MPAGRAPRRAAAATLVALVLGAAALGGCGPFGGEEKLSRAEFISQGDQICERGRERYLDLQKDPPQSAAEAAELTRSLIEITQDEIDALRDLDAPPDSEDALEDYLDSREAGLEVLEKGLAAAQDEDSEAYAEAQAQIARQQVDRARLAEKVGFSECSRPLSGG